MKGWLSRLTEFSVYCTKSFLRVVSPAAYGPEQRLETQPWLPSLAPIHSTFSSPLAIQYTILILCRRQKANKNMVTFKSLLSSEHLPPFPIVPCFFTFLVNRFLKQLPQLFSCHILSCLAYMQQKAVLQEVFKSIVPLCAFQLLTLQVRAVSCLTYFACSKAFTATITKVRRKIKIINTII